MKAVIAAIALAAFAVSSAHAQTSGPQQDYNRTMEICGTAGQVAELNYLMRMHGDAYVLPDSAHGGYRRLLEGAMSAGEPGKAYDRDSAHRAGFSYCIDNIQSSMHDD